MFGGQLGEDGDRRPWIPFDRTLEVGLDRSEPLLHQAVDRPGQAGSIEPGQRGSGPFGERIANAARSHVTLEAHDVHGVRLDSSACRQRPRARSSSGRGLSEVGRRRTAGSSRPFGVGVRPRRARRAGARARPTLARGPTRPATIGTWQDRHRSVGPRRRPLRLHREERICVTGLRPSGPMPLRSSFSQADRRPARWCSGCNPVEPGRHVIGKSSTTSRPSHDRARASSDHDYTPTQRIRPDRGPASVQALRRPHRPRWPRSDGGGGHDPRLLGPNGAGKTTTVSILTTLLSADRGTATVAGADVTTNPNEVRRRIGFPGNTRRSTRISPASRTST